MRYFRLDSPAQAETISRLLYKMMYPANINVISVYLFNWRVVAGITLICIDENQRCPVFQKSDVDTVLADLVAAFGNKIAAKDRTAYRDYLKTNSSVLLINLIPSTLTEYTQQWVTENEEKLTR